VDGGFAGGVLADFARLLDPVFVDSEMIGRGWKSFGLEYGVDSVLRPGWSGLSALTGLHWAGYPGRCPGLVLRAPLALGRSLSSYGLSGFVAPTRHPTL